MNERDIHKQICQLLDKLGIVYIHSRTDKRTTNAAGTPDFIFAIKFIGAVAWEVKLPKGKLSEEQLMMYDRMQCFPNKWNYQVIRSLDDAINGLKDLGYTQ